MPLRWRYLISVPLSGPDNMALDAALVRRARASGEATLRIYSWERPTLSLGRNQPAAAHYDRARAAELGVSFVRRPTGGRAVLHHREVTYSVTAPTAAMGTLAESYGAINRLLLDALARLGVSAREAEPVSPAPKPGIAPCFETPVAGEIVADGRKLVGSAQWRDSGALLQHGSILIADDQWMASALLLDPVPPPPPPATLGELLGAAPSMIVVADALVAAMEHGSAPLVLDDDLRALAARERAHYADECWTWRL